MGGLLALPVFLYFGWIRLAVRDCFKDGFYGPVDNLAGIYDLDPLNKLLAAAGEQQASGPGS